MKTIEFEATPVQHTIRIPDTVPDGVSVRIILSFDDAKTKTVSNKSHWKDLPYSMPNVGNDDDFARENDAKRQAALAHITATQADWQGKPIPDRDALYDDARD